MAPKKGHRGKRYVHLLDDEDVNRWFTNVSRGSVITADIYLRRIGLYCEEHEITPKDFAALKDKELRHRLMDLVTEMEEKGNSGSYIASVLKALKSWLAYNDRKTDFKFKIRDAEGTPTLKEERSPTQEEMKRIILSATSGGRIVCALMAFSGVRPHTLGNYKGDDGLKLGDLPDLLINKDEIHFENTPALVQVRRELSKANHAYTTFLSEEGCEYVIAYLKERAAKGEKLTKKSSLVTPKSSKKAFITSINIGDKARQAIRKAGFGWRPYVLRSYFATQMMLAESKGKVLRDYRQFWMGHKGDIEHRYTINKAQLPPDVIDDMREAYTRATVFIQTTPETGLTAESLHNEVRLGFIKMSGYTEDEIEALGIMNMTDDDIADAAFKKFFSKVNGTNGNTQQVVTAEEAESMIGDGWQYVAQLPNGKIILKAPGLQ